MPQLPVALAGCVLRFCPICDGYEATDKCIGVLGDSEHAGAKALFLRTYSKSVVLFADDAARDDGELSHAGVTLEQALALYDAYHEKASACDVRIEAVLKELSIHRGRGHGAWGMEPKAGAAVS